MQNFSLGVIKPLTKEKTKVFLHYSKLMIPLFRQSIVVVCLYLALISTVQAAYIQRSITIDGDMSDWAAPTDITNNTGQFSNDAEDGSGNDLDEPLSNTGRDLKKFSYTWDSTYLYFYVERYASEKNVTDWWFFIDSTTDGMPGTEPDGLMQSGEKVLRIKWQGANQSTVAEIWEYVESASGGDPLTNGGVGDGYDLPGDVNNSNSLYSLSGGASTGTEMESRIPWTSVLGLTGPANVKFHISSSNGTNLPNNIIDNMDGPAGGQLFPKDLQISKEASVATIRGNQSFTYTVSVFNASIDPMTGVTISDVLPSQVTYVSYVADSGTFSDTDTDTIPDEWAITSIPANTTYTLTVTVTANVLPVAMSVDNTAALTSSTPADEDSSNDSATATVTIQPVPQLTIVKYASAATSDPGGVITYTLDITNIGGDDGYNIEIDDQLSPYVALKIDNGSGHPFIFADSASDPSGLTLGTRSYSVDYGADGYTHTLTDRGDGFDNSVTNFKIIMNGTMNKKVAPSTGGNFTIQYDVIVK